MDRVGSSGGFAEHLTGVHYLGVGSQDSSAISLADLIPSGLRFGEGHAPAVDIRRFTAAAELDNAPRPVFDSIED